MNHTLAKELPLYFKKNHNSNGWYMGSNTNEGPREFNVKLDFLDPDRIYIAEIFRDSDNADWRTNLYGFSIEEMEV